MGRIKTILKTITVLGACTLLYVSNPEKKQHVEALANEVIESVVTMDIDRMDSAVQKVTPEKAQALAQVIVNGSTDVVDLGLMSIGYMDTKDGKRNISVGILGHVFTFMDKTSGRFTEEISKLLEISAGK